MTKNLTKFSKKQWLIFTATLVLIIAFSATTVYAAGDVASAIEGTWNTAKSQIKTVVNNVVFPVVDMVLAVLFFVKSARHTLITRNTDSLNSQLPQSFLRV